MIAYITNIFKLLAVESNAYQQITQNPDNVCIEMDLLKVGSEPVGMRCPFCQEDVMTKANYRNTTITHIIALVLGIFFCEGLSIDHHASSLRIGDFGFQVDVLLLNTIFCEEVEKRRALLPQLSQVFGDVYQDNYIVAMSKVKATD
ncbi:unnamed protein product [Chrysodeixis includens]|uniref:LITAF domain-containing protein n=1 Tax=Chrysodeixis includens TaxID=689277 RepID=A0A9P0BZ07_CHRIL|nr:unnamed protein product [Chrysodeixis includens]